MIDFWIGAGLLLLVALAFLLLPLLRRRGEQTEEDRTALNVALYQERLAEMQAQRAAGVLSEEQFEAGRAEAGRELIDDTEGDAPGRTRAPLGRKVPMALALLLPLLGYGLYLYWGASDKVQLAREFQSQPRSLEEMVARLERTVEAQPDSAEGWYFLARGYMGMERPADSARALERAIELAGREPELLGLLAQARFFANDKQWNDELQTLADEALAGDPDEVTTLGLLGIAAFESGRFADAVRHWERLAASLPPGDPTREAIQSGIDAARERGNLAAESPATPAAAGERGVRVRVSLAPELADKVAPGDSVFIFARAESGPAMPLAVRRLTVAQLPAEVLLNDADAMMPQLKLSAYPKITLVARISRSGDATAGEWLGRSDAVDSSERSLQELVIDQAETR